MRILYAKGEGGCLIHQKTSEPFSFVRHKFEKHRLIWIYSDVFATTFNNILCDVEYFRMMIVDDFKSDENVFMKMVTVMMMISLIRRLIIADGKGNMVRGVSFNWVGYLDNWIIIRKGIL